MTQDREPYGINEYCSHNCCPCCCIVCLSPDELQESNCYCGQHLCYFGRQREYNKGTQTPQVKIDCICPTGKDHVLRGQWVKPHKTQRKQVVIGSTGIMMYPPGTIITTYYGCKKCFGCVTERMMVKE